MRTDQPWKILGIEKTADTRAVKRAYAAQLKAIDPDTDPEGFLALRGAREAALWQIDHEAPHDADDDAVVECPAFAADNREADDGYDDPQQSQAPDTLMRQRLAAILWGEEPIQPLEAEAKELAQHIIATAEAGAIDDAASTENWLVWIAANTIRRSDCVIPLLIHSYNWREQAGTIHATPAHDALLDRYRNLVELYALQRPDHPDHEIFMRLCRPVSGPPNFLEKKLYGRSVRNFIFVMRTISPTVEWDLDEDTVAQWEMAVGRAVGVEDRPVASAWSWFFWMYLVFIIFTFLWGAVQ